MTYYVTVRTPPAIPPPYPRKALAMPGDDGFISMAVRARKERAAAAKRDNPDGLAHFRSPATGGQAPRRVAWASQLPDGKFSRDDAATAWGVASYCAKQRLLVLRAVGLVDCLQRRTGGPGVWRRVDE